MAKPATRCHMLICASCLLSASALVLTIVGCVVMPEYMPSRHFKDDALCRVTDVNYTGSNLDCSVCDFADDESCTPIACPCLVVHATYTALSRYSVAVRTALVYADVDYIDSKVSLLWSNSDSQVVRMRFFI